MAEDDVRAIKFAYRKLFLHKGENFEEGIATVQADEKYGKNPYVTKLLRFLKESERGCLH